MPEDFRFRPDSVNTYSISRFLPSGGLDAHAWTLTDDDSLIPSILCDSIFYYPGSAFQYRETNTSVSAIVINGSDEINRIAVGINANHAMLPSIIQNLSGFTEESEVDDHVSVKAVFTSGGRIMQIQRKFVFFNPENEVPYAWEVSYTFWPDAKRNRGGGLTSFPAEEVVHPNFSVHRRIAVYNGATDYYSGESDESLDQFPLKLPAALFHANKLTDNIGFVHSCALMLLFEKFGGDFRISNADLNTMLQDNFLQPFQENA